MQTDDFSARSHRILAELCLALQSALTLSKQETWHYLLNLSARLCQIWPTISPTTLSDEVISLLVHVANLRDALADGGEVIEMSSLTNVNSLIDEMDRLIFTAMEAWGIETVLSNALPLEPLLVEL